MIYNELGKTGMKVSNISFAILRSPQGGDCSREGAEADTARPLLSLYKGGTLRQGRSEPLGLFCKEGY